MSCGGVGLGWGSRYKPGDEKRGRDPTHHFLQGWHHRPGRGEEGKSIARSGHWWSPAHLLPPYQSLTWRAQTSSGVTAPSFTLQDPWPSVCKQADLGVRKLGLDSVQSHCSYVMLSPVTWPLNISFLNQKGVVVVTVTTSQGLQWDRELYHIVW